MRKIVLFLLLLAITLPMLASASDTPIRLPLLAVQENPDGTYQGSTADLFLELREGSGRVFLDTNPLTKIDTQISTRYAKEIACDYFDLDCDHYDFIYTIRANSNIIGGPSAGTAIAALTTLAVMDINYDEKVAITGTINSGGIVGPVGGVKEKIEAAADQGLSKVLISLGSGDQEAKNMGGPVGEVSTKEAENENPLTQGEGPLFDADPYQNLIGYGQETLGIEVVEVSDLNEVLFHLTDQKLKEEKTEFIVDESYVGIMQDLETELCGRSDDLEAELDLLLKTAGDADLDAIEETISQRRTSAQDAIAQGDHYSAASFCFGLNVFLQTQLTELQDYDDDAVNQEMLNIRETVNILSKELEETVINTISSLQTKMIVEERLLEVLNLLTDTEEAEDRDTKIASLAFAKERLYSAISWMQFFEMEGKLFLVNDKALAEACSQKIAEAQERFQYVETYLPELDLEGIDEKLTRAEMAEADEEHTVCLMQASQAKAESSSILSSLGISQDNFNASLESRLRAVEKVIAENTEEGIFPILGFSYYEYAKSLAKDDTSYSSLLYLEYALELSDLDIYFPEERPVIKTNTAILPEVSTFSSGFIMGLILGLILMWLWHEGKSRRIQEAKK